MLGLGLFAHEHPLAHGIRSQLLRVLYLAELDSVYGHACLNNSREKGGSERENVRYDDIEGHLFTKIIVFQKMRFFGTDREGLLVGLGPLDPYLHLIISAPRRRDDVETPTTNNRLPFLSKTNGTFLL